MNYIKHWFKVGIYETVGFDIFTLIITSFVWFVTATGGYTEQSSFLFVIYILIDIFLTCSFIVYWITKVYTHHIMAHSLWKQSGWVLPYIKRHIKISKEDQHKITVLVKHHSKRYCLLQFVFGDPKFIIEGIETEKEIRELLIQTPVHYPNQEVIILDR